MVEVFSNGVEQDIAQVLRNRDARVMEQSRLAQQVQKHQSLINAKLNIPGPIKNNFYLSRVFQKGVADFLTDLTVDWQLLWDVATGPEIFAIVEGEPTSVKEKAIKFENNDALGRLFDIDILESKDGMMVPLSRSRFELPERKCLICDKPAKVCARNRTHSVQEMQAYINQLINQQLELS